MAKMMVEITDYHMEMLKKLGVGDKRSTRKEAAWLLESIIDSRAEAVGEVPSPTTTWVEGTDPDKDLSWEASTNG
jgi:hypothetical protein